MAGIQHVLHKACPYSSLRRIIFPRAAYKNSGVPWSGFKPAFRPHSLHSFHGTILLATLKAGFPGNSEQSPWAHTGDRALYCRANHSILLSLSTGKHFHGGLWRHVPRDPPGQTFCLPLHRVRDYSQRDAHFHPLQQVLRLLQQAQSLRVHGHPPGAGKGELCAESHEEDGGMFIGKQHTAHHKARELRLH